MGPEDVLALIREQGARGLGRTPLRLPEPAGAFRAMPMAGLVRGKAPEGAALEVEEPPPAVEIAPPPPPAPDPALIEAARAEGFAAGHAAGLAEGQALGRTEAEAALDKARRAFEAAAARLSAPTAADTAHLAQAIDHAVRLLAGQRAGLAIDAHPAAFAARIEALADRVSQGLRQVSVRLNPQDLAAVTPHLAGSDLLAEARLAADPRLGRGDAEIRAEGIVLSDLLEPRP
ncbi:flagellar assembly protein FliH [Cereibacter ovatus]|uniref:Flagellar assembly protein FliH n=2 Tax=Cereibacter ovatus TaxID=439529 RepID=A0A285CL94_9RHOB|nr:flagellar assembly protein FliH [Cereibacter ovatus]